MEKKEELKQEKDVQQPQVAETQEKPNLIADDQVNWEELRKCGIDKEKLSEKDLKALMNYGKTGLVTVKPTFSTNAPECASTGYTKTNKKSPRPKPGGK